MVLLVLLPVLRLALLLVGSVLALPLVLVLVLLVPARLEPWPCSCQGHT